MKRRGALWCLLLLLLLAGPALQGAAEEDLIVDGLVSALKASGRKIPQTLRYDSLFEESGRSYHLVIGGENHEDHYVNTAWFHIDARTGEVLSFDLVADRTSPTGMKIALPGASTSPGAAPAPAGPESGELPDLAKVELAEGDLRVKSAWELDLLRNAIYARHGYAFKKAALKEFFAKQPWYKPKRTDAPGVEKEFSPLERKNLELIVAIQKGQRLAPPISPEPAAEQAEFIDDEGNVRDGPAVGRKVLFAPKAGTRAGILDRQGDWFKLAFSDQPAAIGWTHKKNVRVVRSTSDPLAEFEKNGHRVRATVDLDGDGSFEEITLRAVRHEESGDATWFQIVVEKVIGSGRHLLWEDKAGAFPFVIGDFGVEDLTVTGDLDGDRRCEILSSAPASDVSPARFRLLRWDGNGFVLVKSGFLAATGRQPQAFRWQDAAPDPQAAGAWLFSIRSAGDPRTLVASGMTGDQLFEATGTLSSSRFLVNRLEKK